MSASYLEPVLFIENGEAYSLDCKQFPYLYNNQGRCEQYAEPKGSEIALAPDDPQLDMGAKYSGIDWREKRIPTRDGGYMIKAFDFHAELVEYQPLRATQATAQAFGMTLLRAGECIRFEYDGLVCRQYKYGQWASYQSPYLEFGRRRELLTYNPTDLEYHDFPHVFFSRHRSLPLVISVARWRPYAHEISLADVWLAPGDALVLPPQRFPEPLPPGASKHDAWMAVANLHGNRNAALACRFQGGEAGLLTETILGNAEVMQAPATRPHYHEEQTPTRHTRPACDDD
ncbi:hypothetical protein [Burkholderia ubonensis]|uniref:Uncharacterized protein n=1 Tax=Burkholderia ubonensis TaxID=101571 RepID=A0AB74CXV7_9BURK|nr:hypothetical protein [Burkholderia ubonensis]PAJ79177.1 hypothetical protein CJO71_20085 [Burkholderia ubonensis]PAJ84961.1 hypothetical protein CJO70_25465 [Burkholderia ubonensis]PAJ91874.1 hypothetical protein CJO69_25090 [Burkholderia ubonensis]PAJ98588.1 hypothetical protein CJO68_24155 [Burkholderia ubonensis]PAK04706.1 hypothetical protein CJO67_28085 [Burkholderia ubonensis]